MDEEVIIDKLMVVAHPDDESLFGGQELLREPGWLVVCITNGDNALRREEFFSAMKQVNGTGIIWSYPDQAGLSRNPVKARASWRPFLEEMQQALTQISSHYAIARVVTHGPDGEYNHEHHKMVYHLVRGVFSDKSVYCFSRGEKIEASILRKKKVLLDIYDAQLTESEKIKYADWIHCGSTVPDDFCSK